MTRIYFIMLRRQVILPICSSSAACRKLIEYKAGAYALSVAATLNMFERTHECMSCQC